MKRMDELLCLQAQKRSEPFNKPTAPDTWRSDSTRSKCQTDPHKRLTPQQSALLTAPLKALSAEEGRAPVSLCEPSQGSGPWRHTWWGRAAATVSTGRFRSAPFYAPASPQTSELRETRN